MNVFVVNCGSSSLKYQLINSDTEEVIAKGLCERIGIDGRLTHKPTGKEQVVKEVAMPDHKSAVSYVLEELTDPTAGVIKDLSEIDAVGHRIVHGGEKFAQSVVITDDVMKAIEECNDLAPLHNPANLIGISACKALMPEVPMVAVFDTAFHQTMPKKAYLYGLPYEYYEDYKIRKYGFHGTSHSFVSKRLLQIIGKENGDSKVIICHLGNGSSITAVQNGKSVDTSMGFTPLDGLIMGTRSGSIDPAVVQYIAGKKDYTIDEVLNVLNKQSGVEGISGVSSDFRDLDAASMEGNERATVALDMFAYRAAQYIGSYVAAMNGVDAIAFTAGIGENNFKVRKAICDYLGYLGITIDEQANAVRGEEIRLSTEDSKVAVYVIPTNEELAIARETVALVG
ncbi:MAG: acetate kinase [Lachnospiraceae bacterium]|nr:acetate kinase [Lachnospiraceae bacterium]HCJ09142.1 acetate kinase [Lachnospiraceae bacterium]